MIFRGIDTLKSCHGGRNSSIVITDFAMVSLFDTERNFPSSIQLRDFMNDIKLEVFMELTLLLFFV